MMNGKKNGCRTVNIQGMQFVNLDHATKNQNGCSSPSYKKLNLIQTQDWRNWCSTAHLKN
jgi:hypothetical protein